MKRTTVSILTLALAAGSAFAAGDNSADNGNDSGKKVTVHGSVQAEILFPETDVAIGTQDYDDKILGNGYANVGLYSKYVDAGLRLEYLEHPLPGFELNKGWGVPNIFVKGRYAGVELTIGDYYEQFGSGFILRTYEDRALGIDNSLRGVRAKVTSLKGFTFTALGGVQRRFWDWDLRSKVFGADVEFRLSDYWKTLEDKNMAWNFGASYVLKHERDEEILVAGTNNRLNLPKNVSAFDLRSQFYYNGLDIKAEYAWKSQDPSYYNNYTYRYGSAIMLSAGYSQKGYSMLLQAKRSDNMSFRSERSESEAAGWINNMPPFNVLTTYSLTSLYPYATQDAPGEWAFMADFAYTFRRGTPMGGKYGTKFKLNASYICGIDRDPISSVKEDLYGTDWWNKGGGGFGKTYYSDISLQMEKKLTRQFELSFMYMFQKYNKTQVEGHGGMINSNIFVAEGKWKMSRKLNLRTELQYLQTKDDDKDWAYGLLELSINPYLMLSVSDQWNCGGTGNHYYMACVTGTYRNNRLLVGYGRTRAGYNCAGGVCRYVPATRGFQVTYSYNF